MHPERRFFPLQQQTTSVTSIRTNLLADLYVALGDSDTEGNWTVRVYWKPLVPWIWIGCVIMAFGGVVSLSDRRWRVGAGARASRRPIAPPTASRRIDHEASGLSAAARAVHGARGVFRDLVAAEPRHPRTPLGDDREAGPRVRPGRTGHHKVVGSQRAEGTPPRHQLLRVLVRPLPDRAPAADAVGRTQSPPAVRHRLQGQAGRLRHVCWRLSATPTGKSVSTRMAVSG